ncbi:MAG: ImmA/IrrE family metallo-endopeptidase [Ktedonobacterales bacterium]|nr:ImmA/IrrE family metallo-endopeptidase [Ktedonobacterales bacterium]
MIGDRMRQARLAAGLTLDEVTGRLAHLGQVITKQGLSKYEHNKSIPKASFLLKLAEALGVKSSYFLEEPALRVRWLAFRKHPRLAPTRQAQIQATALHVAEGQVRLASVFYPDERPQLPRVGPIRTFADAETAAERLREAWGLGDAPIESVTRAVEDHGGVVVGWKHDEGRFDGLAGWANGAIPVIVTNTSVAPDRRRFSLAHELEHLLAWQPGAPDDQDEQLAHRFAGAFLVPREVVRRELGVKRRHLSFEELGLLKGTYGMSMQAWVHRARDLDIIDEGHYHSLWDEFTRRQWRIREPVECVTPEEPTRLKQMTLRALAEGIITEEQALALCPGSVEPRPLAHPAGRRYTATELMRLPFEARERILAEQSKQAVEAYQTNPALTDFEAFGEDDLYDDYPE